MRFTRSLPLALLALAATGSTASAQDLWHYEFIGAANSIFNETDNGPLPPEWVGWMTGDFRVSLIIDRDVPGSGGFPVEVYGNSSVVASEVQLFNGFAGIDPPFWTVSSPGWSITVRNDELVGGFAPACFDGVEFVSASPIYDRLEINFEVSGPSTMCPLPLSSTEIPTCFKSEAIAMAGAFFETGWLIIHDVGTPGLSSDDTYLALGGLPGVVENLTVTHLSGFSDGCFGDGGDQMGCSDCPCMNESTVGSGGGCKHSQSDAMFGGAGARLIPLGSSSLAKKDLTFEMEGALPSSFAVLTSSTFLAPGNPANPCFAQNPGSGIQAMQLDGLRCLVGMVTRHASRAIDINGNVNADNTAPNGRWGPGNEQNFLPPGSFPNDSVFVIGETRHFQAIYRELPGLTCGREANTSQRVTTTFTP